MKWKLLFTLLIAGIIVSGSPVFATILEVGCAQCEYESIQAAINDANYGDTVRVYSNGDRYQENITMKNGVNVIGTGSPIPVLTRGNGEDPIITFDDPAITPVTQLKYLELVDGLSDYGAGIYIESGASPTISHNIIRDMQGGSGTGIFVFTDSEPIITYNEIFNCVSSSLGGGILIFDNGPQTLVAYNDIHHNIALEGGGFNGTFLRGVIFDNDIHDNATYNTGKGGGLYVSGSGNDLLVMGNQFQGNQAKYGGGMYCTAVENSGFGYNDFTANNAFQSGGGAFLYACSGMLSGGEWTRNTAGFTGGGLYVYGWGGGITLSRLNLAWNWSEIYGGALFVNYEDNTKIVNCFVRRNIAEVGAGIYFYESDHAVLVNNTIAWNLDDDFSPGDGLILGSRVGSKHFYNNWFAFNGTAARQLGGFQGLWNHNNAYFGNENDLINITPGDDNITGDAPDFVSNGVDLHLQENDPGINQGCVDNFDSPDRDIDGQARLDADGFIDIGADEFR